MLTILISDVGARDLLAAEEKRAASRLLEHGRHLCSSSLSDATKREKKSVVCWWASWEKVGRVPGS